MKFVGMGFGGLLSDSVAYLPLTRRREDEVRKQFVLFTDVLMNL